MMIPLLINSMPGTESPWVHVKGCREVLFQDEGEFRITQWADEENGSIMVSSNLWVEEGHRHTLLKNTTKVKTRYIQGPNGASVDMV